MGCVLCRLLCIFPDRELVELNADHEIFHTFYDIDGPQMIPGRGGSRALGKLVLITQQITLSSTTTAG